MIERRHQLIAGKKLGDTSEIYMKQMIKQN